MPEKDINYYVADAHRNSIEKGFWDVLEETKDLVNNGLVPLSYLDRIEDLVIAAKIALVHSELSEMLEAVRDGDYSNFKEESADAHIRLFDIEGYHRMDIQAEIEKKMTKNSGRPRLHGKRL